MQSLSTISRASAIRVVLALILTFTVCLVISQKSAIHSYAEHLPKIAARPHPIPNIVHYTQLQKTEHSDLHFSFEAFLSLYGALRILKPEKIYIHTNFNESMLERAAQNGSKWTRMVLTTFKEVIINHVKVAEHVNGMKIKNIEAKSDLVRWEETYDKGGIYLDWDVHTLRDVKILREAGFQNVVGRQPDGPVNTGCFMSQKKSAMAGVMRREQYIVFDNSWGAHSVDLLTTVAERLAGSPGEVLIMEAPAFAPYNWQAGDMDQLMGPHNESPVPPFPQVNDVAQDPYERWNNKSRSRDWEHDFSPSYFLHAFKFRGHKIEGYKGVTAKYILERDSNFALATWKTVQMGIEEGLFSPDDDEV